VGMLSPVLVTVLAALFLRTDLTFSVEPVRNPVNVVLSDGSVRNAYALRLRNMTGYDREIRISARAEAPLALELQDRDGLAVTVPADETLRQRIYLTSPPDSAASRTELMDVTLIVEDTASGSQVSESTGFHGNPQ